jgi:hypothetical protein
MTMTFFDPPATAAQRRPLRATDLARWLHHDKLSALEVSIQGDGSARIQIAPLPVLVVTEAAPVRAMADLLGALADWYEAGALTPSSELTEAVASR